MHVKLDEAIAQIIEQTAKGRQLSVGLLLLGNSSVAGRLAQNGHRVVIIGDRFRLLFRLYNRLKGLAPGPPEPLLIEACFDALPFRAGSLDALVLTGGLPRGPSPVETLETLRTLLKPSGLIIWPHPLATALGGLWRVKPVAREHLTAWAMGAKFEGVGQRQLPGTLRPWVITTGQAGHQPWEPGLKKVARSASN
jgi:hypothetical protein